jgi:polyferredoxin
MGIDIRDGQQLECITCALCIDACDDVMDRLGKERGLISYATLNDYNTNMRLAMDEGDRIDPNRVRKEDGGFIDKVKLTNWRSIIRPRTVAYFMVWAAIGLGMLTVLSLRARLDVNVLHDRNPLYVALTDGTYRNGYDVKILNMTPEHREVTVTLEGLPGGEMWLAGQANEPQQAITMTLEPDKVLPVRLYVAADPALLDGPHTSYTIHIDDATRGETASARLKFEAPEEAFQ